MLSAEAVVKKKKKKSMNGSVLKKNKARLLDETDMESSVLKRKKKKKKRVVLDDSEISFGKEKKVKKKKHVQEEDSNNISIVSSTQKKPSCSDEDDVDLFSSQSPIKHSPPPSPKKELIVKKKRQLEEIEAFVSPKKKVRPAPSSISVNIGSPNKAIPNGKPSPKKIGKKRQPDSESSIKSETKKERRSPLAPLTLPVVPEQVSSTLKTSQSPKKMKMVVPSPDGNVVKSPYKRPTLKDRTPIQKFAKKSKIIPHPDANKKLYNPEQVFEDIDVNDESEDDSESASELEEEEEEKPVLNVDAPPKDVVITPRQQKLRDYALVAEVERLFPNAPDNEIDWSQFYLYGMQPEEISERYQLITRNISRIKTSKEVASEYYRSCILTEVEERVPLAQRDLRASRGVYPIPKVKRVNAFTLFCQNKDSILSKREMKEQWESLGKLNKRALQDEARRLNIERGVVKRGSGLKGSVNAYSVFTKDHLMKGSKMVELGQLWKDLSEDKRMAYKARAEEINLERAKERSKKSSGEEVGEETARKPVAKAPRKASAYNIFTKQERLKGLTMEEIGAKWRQTLETEKEHYRKLADETNGPPKEQVEKVKEIEKAEEVEDVEESDDSSSSSST